MTYNNVLAMVADTVDNPRFIAELATMIAEQREATPESRTTNGDAVHNSSTKPSESEVTGEEVQGKSTTISYTPDEVVEALTAHREDYRTMDWAIESLRYAVRELAWGFMVATGSGPSYPDQWNRAVGIARAVMEMKQ